MKHLFVLVLGSLFVSASFAAPVDAQAAGNTSRPATTLSGAAAATAEADRKLPPQMSAAYMFVIYYVKNTDALSEACAQQAVSVSTYTRRFTELHAPLLLIASKYLDLRDIPDDARASINNAIRAQLMAFAKTKNTDFPGACKELQRNGYELAEHATFANVMPAYYRDLNTEPPPPPPKDPNQVYIQRISRLLRFHIHFDVPAGLQDNPGSTYQVDLAPVGLVRDIQVIQQSPLAGFDQAVIKAIRTIEPFPKRDDGSIPPRITFTWWPKD